ncbi:hypothetical protein [Bosea sp. (in: a-proteobacteria)]|uniref:hypothetical protein n=1 Tax=Bosea sp. (in: a-proteobacteria) TaxID=1871050 RepID=UPI0027363878|nr:hypothetical protein [Bosea sp. (in: a-proteobacteria)]MDP3411192.1 hypothetical protein [Bosea sp. (in: a-proteobacteria)]
MALVTRLFGGLLVWAAGFAVIYGAHGLGCGLGWGERPVLGPFTPLNMALIPLWLASLLVAAWALRHAGRDSTTLQEPALRRAALIGGWAGLVGLVVMGAPVLLPAHCL